MRKREEVRDLVERLIEKNWSTKRVLWAVRRASPATRTTLSEVEALRRSLEARP